MTLCTVLVGWYGCAGGCVYEHVRRPRFSTGPSSFCLCASVFVHLGVVVREESASVYLGSVSVGRLVDWALNLRLNRRDQGIRRQRK